MQHSPGGLPARRLYPALVAAEIEPLERHAVAIGRVEEVEIAVAGDRGDGEILGDVPIGAQRGLPELVVLERTEIRVPVGGARVVWGRGGDERWKTRRHEAAGGGRAGGELRDGLGFRGGGEVEGAVAGDRGDGEILGDVPIGAQRGLPELVVLERTEIRVPVGGARVVWGRGVDERWKIRRNDAAGAG